MGTKDGLEEFNVGDELEFINEGGQISTVIVRWAHKRGYFDNHEFDLETGRVTTGGTVRHKLGVIAR